MATVTARGIVWTTATGAKTVASFTPTAGDLIVAVVGTAGTDTAPTISDNDSSITSWTLADSFRSYGAAVTGGLRIYVSGQGASGSAMTVTQTPGAADTGGGLAVFSVTGASAYGASAIRSSGGQADQAAGTPAPALSNTPLTANAVLVAVMTNTNGSANATVRTGYAEHYDQGFNTPPSGLEVQSRASGETSATLTTGGATPSGFAAIGIEIASNVAAVATLVNFRVRSGDTVGLNADTGWAGAGATDVSMAVDTTFRVRHTFEETAGAIPAYTLDGQLECNLNGGAWQNVTTSSTVLKAVASSQFNDGDATTDVLTAGSGMTFTAGQGSETGDPTPKSLSAQHTEHEYALQIVSANVVNNDVINVRPKPFTPGAAGLLSLTVVEAVAHSRPVNDTIAGTDAVAKAATHPLADTGTLGDAIDPVLTPAGVEHEQPVDDSIAGTDAQTKAATHPLADTGTVTDSTARAWTAVRSQPDAIAGTDAQAKTARHPLADAIAGTDARSSRPSHAIADTAAGTDAQTRRPAKAQADTIAGTDAKAARITRPQADAGTVTDATARVWAAKLTVADGIGATDDVDTSAAGANAEDIDDAATVTDAVTRETETVRTAADSIAGTDASARRVTRTQADAVAGTDARTRVWAAKLTIADGLSVTDGVDTQTTGANDWVRAVDDSVAVTDATARRPARSLADVLAGTDATTSAAGHRLGDSLVVTDARERLVAYLRTRADAGVFTDDFEGGVPIDRWPPDSDVDWMPDTDSSWASNGDGPWPADTDEPWAPDTDEDWEAQTDDRWLVSAESKW